LAPMSRLALGTVQFGLRYGVANQGERVSLEEAARIVRHARDGGLDTLDTAIAYGDSELRLGEIGIGGWRVVSKLPDPPTGCADVRGWVEESTTRSLERLKIPCLSGLLLHRAANLATTQADELYSAMQGLKSRGLVRKIGISIYGPEELDECGARFPLDLVQAPFNIVDRRLHTSGWLARLKSRGTEVHTRSAFLQGLLLLPPHRRPRGFDRWKSIWNAWDGWLAGAKLSPISACLGFPLRYPQIDRVVIGVDDLTQMLALLAYEAACLAEPPIELASEDLDLINPSRWSSH